jgi:chromosome segregation ATPase
MSALFDGGRKVEELESAVARMTETINSMEARITGLEETITFVQEQNTNTRDRIERLQEEVRGLREKSEVSVLSSARKDVGNRTEEAIEKARNAVNEYLKPLTE